MSTLLVIVLVLLGLAISPFLVILAQAVCALALCVVGLVISAVCWAFACVINLFRE